jgi:hypothetical protein
VAAGLTYAFDGNFGLIDFRERGELRECGVDVLNRFAVLERVSNIAAVQGVLIRMLVVEIWRDADEAVAR